MRGQDFDAVGCRCYDLAMRTTLTIDDDVLAVARAFAERKGISVGRAVSELARRGYENTAADRGREAGAVFDVPADAKTITTEDVYRALEDWP